MEKLLNHSQLRDLHFIALVLVNLLLIGGFLISGVGGGSGPPGGWRRVDLTALQTRIEAGQLLDVEARWYQRETADDAGGRHE